MTALDMNPEIRAKWAAALKSGEYPQCKDVLRCPDGGGWCCLGVLCDLAEKAGVVTGVMRDGDWSYDGNVHELPAAVMAWAGLDDSNPRVTEGHSETDTLAGHNDNGVAFARIADLIEGKRAA